MKVDKEIVLKYMYLADRVARLIDDSYMDYEERRSVCYEGLIRCLARKNESKIDDMGSFLFISMKNYLIDALKKNKAYKNNLPLDEDLYLAKGDIEEECIDRESLKQALAKIDPEERKILLLKYVGDQDGIQYTQEELGKMLHLSLSTVKRRSSSGLDKLRKEYGLSK